MALQRSRGERLPYLRQLDNVVENMAMCAKYARERGFVMEIEPLCTQAHPGIFINTASLGAEIAAAVDNPSCRILLDVFHEQTQTGSLASLDDDIVWRYIESFHLADAPRADDGRNRLSARPQKDMGQGLQGLHRFGIRAERSHQRARYADSPNLQGFGFRY